MKPKSWPFIVTWNFIWSRRKPASHIQFCFLLIEEGCSANWRLTWVVMASRDKAVGLSWDPVVSHKVSAPPRMGYGVSPTLRTTGYWVHVSSLKCWQWLQCTRLKLLIILSLRWSVGRENVVPAYNVSSYRWASWFNRYSSLNQVELELENESRSILFLPCETPGLLLPFFEIVLSLSLNRLLWVFLT